MASASQKVWTGFRSVLCPIDFSQQSRLALKYAQAVALRGSAALTVTFANDPLLVAAAAAALHDRNIARRSASELRAFVNTTLAASSKRRLRVRSEVSTGEPTDEIIKTANRRRSDLIVLGTHGLTGTDRLLLGSTTLSVLQQTSIPVLAIPRVSQSPTGALLRSWPGQRIVAALDLEDDPSREVDTAARVAQGFGSSLLLLHVVDRISAPAWIKAALSSHERIRLAQAQQQMEEVSRRAQRRVKTDMRVICGRVSDEIAALVASERVGLTITALRDRRGWFGSRRGSVSYHVLSHAVTSVLAYPPRWRPR